MRYLIAAGLVFLAALSASRGEAQVPQPTPRVAQLVPATDAASQIAALQQQVAALQAAVQALQVKTQFVTATGSSYTLNVPGQVVIDGTGFTVRSRGANSNVQIWADNSIDLRGATYALLQGGIDAALRSGDTARVFGAFVQINPNGAPAATVGSVIRPATPSALGTVLTGSSTVLIGK